MIKVKFKYILETGEELLVEAEVGIEPRTKVAHVSWDEWTINGEEVLETDNISDTDKERIYQQIMDEYEEITHTT